MGVNVINAPESIPCSYPLVFLAGGANTDWRKEFIGMFSIYSKINFLNPKRDDWQKMQQIGWNAIDEQIEWEARALEWADILVFWFTEGTTNPISLLELGKYGLASDKPLFIGCDPKYEKRYDVIKQTELARSEVKIVDSLSDLARSLYINVFEKR